jgi:hypothetical protein
MGLSFFLGGRWTVLYFFIFLGGLVYYAPPVGEAKAFALVGSSFRPYVCPSSPLPLIRDYCVPNGRRTFIFGR